MTTQEKAVELARETIGIAEVSYENGVITASELNDARLSLLETEWELMQAKYNQIVAAARTRYAAGLCLNAAGQLTRHRVTETQRFKRSNLVSVTSSLRGSSHE